MSATVIASRWAQRRSDDALWALAAFAIALGIGAATLLSLGATERGLFIALRATGRWSFLVFWLAYTAPAMATLFGPAFRPLAQRARAFGLSFAAAQLVHVGLVVWLYRVAPLPPVPSSSLEFFGIGVGFTYMLAMLSFNAVSRRFDPALLWIIRTVGVQYIAYAFVTDLMRNPFHGGWLNLVLYLPFLGLIAAAAGLRLGALIRRNWPANWVAQAHLQ